MSSITYLILYPFSTIFNSCPDKGIEAMPHDDIITVKELVAYLKIAEKTAYCFASDGKG